MMSARNTMPDTPIKILFIGEIDSSHAQNWISLLQGDATYKILALHIGSPFNTINLPFTTFDLYPSNIPTLVACKLASYANHASQSSLLNTLAAIGKYGKRICVSQAIKKINAFNPTILHSFGFWPTAQFCADTLLPALDMRPRWVLQTRGGSDIYHAQASPKSTSEFKRILPLADAVVSDNPFNYDFFKTLGISVKRPDESSFFPGTGGMDCKTAETLPPSRRKPIVLWPKAYDSTWSKALPVLEAIKKAWPQMGDVRFIFTATDTEVRTWVQQLPPNARLNHYARTHTKGRSACYHASVEGGACTISCRRHPQYFL